MKRTIFRRIWELRNPRRLASVVLRRLHLSQFFVIHTNGIRLRFFPAVWTINLWENPRIFDRDTDLLSRWLRPGDVLVDCGANVGLLTLVGSSLVGAAGTVYSIEAHPRAFAYLQSNVLLNEAKNVKLFHTAVGEKEGIVSFSDQLTDDGNHIVPLGAGLSIPMSPLDAIVPVGCAVRLLKIDVEGYEKFVIEGGRALIPRVQAIYFESSEELFARYGYTCHELFLMLRDAGFTLLRLRDDGTVEQISSNYVSREIENLIAVRDTKAFIHQTGFAFA